MQAYNAIKGYRDLASSKYGAEKFTGIATAVFRESTNGEEFIKQVSRDLGIHLTVRGSSLHCVPAGHVIIICCESMIPSVVFESIILLPLCEGTVAYNLGSLSILHSS